jgi:hypothetical protein
LNWGLILLSYLIYWWVYFKFAEKGYGRSAHSIFEKEASKHTLFTILFIIIIASRIIIPFFTNIDIWWHALIFLIVVEVLDYLDSICIKKTKGSTRNYFRFLDDLIDWISRAIFVRNYLYLWWVSGFIIWYIVASFIALKDLKYRFLKTFGVDVSYVLPIYIHLPIIFLHTWIFAYYIYFTLFYLSYDVPEDRAIIENRIKKNRPKFVL